MPTTRGQSLQTTSALPSARKAGPSSQHVESFVSTSTASLPPRYTITLALPPKGFPPALSEIERQYLRGEEFLADGWRRKDDTEGKLEDLQEQRRKRKRLTIPVIPGGSPEASCAKQAKDHSLSHGEPLWYTAGLQYPCTCQLPSLPRAYIPSRPAPRADLLLPLPVAPQTAQIPQVGDSLVPWSDPQATSDLDPALDELETFESQWRSADGSGWERVTSTAGRTHLCKADGEAFESLTLHQENVFKRTLDKGKERATDTATSMFPPHPPIKLANNFTPTLGPPAARPGPPIDAAAWDAESKRRKQAWRERISADAAYGQMWSVIPRPHQLESSFVSRGHKRIHPDRAPDYILPRFFLRPTAPHTYHPSLPAFISAHPKARVHWLIPIHGPVFVPSLRGSSTTKTDPPIPSTSTLSPHLPEINKHLRPALLTWTPSLLSHFWSSFLLPLHADLSQPFGPISIRLSGPKPDPFLALKPPPPLMSHQHILEIEAGGLAPDRPECGDHIRFYCDAKRCLSLRTWLNGIEVDLKDVKGQELGQGRGQGMHRPFEKVRLCLVGERGEVLTVA